MSLLDPPIDPQSLAEEILEVLRASGGPTLRSAIRDRCKWSVSADYFSGEFGKLVLEGKVVAIGGAGPRVVYQLASHVENTAARSFARRGNSQVAGWNRSPQKKRATAECNRSRQKLLELMSDGCIRNASCIKTEAGFSQGVSSYLIKQLTDEGALVNLGHRASSRYQIPQGTKPHVMFKREARYGEVPSPEIKPLHPAAEPLTVRVKLDAHQVQPFFAFLKRLKSGSEAMA